METYEFWRLVVIDLITLLPFLISFIVAFVLICNGIKCLLRSSMLRTYYHNKDIRQIRQYELENFVFLYKAYKALRGNSFIDKIYKEVMEWEVVS